MKKWLRYSVAIILIMVLVGGSWFTYTFFIKDYETADENVDKIVDTEFDVELIENSGNANSDQLISDNKETDEEVEITESSSTSKKEYSESTTSQENHVNKDSQRSTKSSKPSNKTTQTKNQKNQNTHENTDTEDNKSNVNEEEENKEQDSKQANEDTVTAEDIKDRYRPSFQALQDQALAKLNNLVTYAYDEYKKKEKSGAEVSYGYFYNKYKSAAKKLEAQTDATFYRLYASLQQDLVQNGFSKKDATDVKKYYNQKKDERENQMLSKVLKKF